MMNPWHDIKPLKTAPDIINAVIEIPKESKMKYELDKESGFLKLDRVLYSSVVYPANYGFVPQTYCDDKDPLDILVIAEEPIYPMTIVKVKPIGVIEMIDRDEIDYKVISVISTDPVYNTYNDIKELPNHLMKRLERFFMDYKKLEGKKVRIGKMLGAVQARKIIVESRKMYNELKDELKK